MSSTLVGRGRAGGPVDGSRLPVRTRDRRPALAALALLLVVAGALGAALVVYRTGQRTDVLVAARTIHAGERITAADFGVARVSADAGATVQAASEDAFIGSYATTDVPAGTLVNNQMFQVGQVLPPEGVVVGVTVSVGQRPAGDLVTGEVVRAYFVSRTGSTSATTATPGTVIAPAARVVATATADNSGTVTVSLLVTAAEAAQLATASNAGAVDLAQLPTGTRPELDFRRAG